MLDCNLVAGDFDYLLKIRVRGMADSNKLHGQKLIALPGVRQTRTFFVMIRGQGQWAVAVLKGRSPAQKAASFRSIG